MSAGLGGISIATAEAGGGCTEYLFLLPHSRAASAWRRPADLVSVDCCERFATTAPLCVVMAVALASAVGSGAKDPVHRWVASGVPACEKR